MVVVSIYVFTNAFNIQYSLQDLINFSATQREKQWETANNI